MCHDEDDLMANAVMRGKMRMIYGDDESHHENDLMMTD
jgi:hypothetical protein